MTEMNPFALSYTFDNRPISEYLEKMQTAIDLAKITPVEDPMKETLRLAVLTGGANATLGLGKMGDLPTHEVMWQLEEARTAAHQEQILKEAVQARVLGNAVIDLA